MSMQIHPTAIIYEGAQLGPDVTVGPYVVIGPHVTLGEGVVVQSHSVIEGHTTIGPGTKIFPHAVIGTQTQDLKYRGERTFVDIGARCQIREFVTINSSSGEDTRVSVGDECLIMACCHVAHHCSVGSRVIMANGVLLAGHVTIEEGATIGGMTPIHQWVRIGRHAMVGGMSGVGYDVPPYMIGGGVPFRMGGINLVGLKRRNVPLTTRNELALAFRILYRQKLRTHEAMAEIAKCCQPVPEILHLLEFIQATSRGLVCMHGATEGSRQEADSSC
ncbi:MAG: acyl-ACP--UDP-N-acetylglucosamine O-acyltransferase [Chlamydiia bacterium]